MSKTTMVQVYTAMTEAEVRRQYAAGTAEAERNGYVPTSEVWDRNTLTVTYQYRGSGALTGRVPGAEASEGGLRSTIRRLIGSR